MKITLTVINSDTPTTTFNKLKVGDIFVKTIVGSTELYVKTPTEYIKDKIDIVPMNCMHIKDSEWCGCFCSDNTKVSKVDCEIKSVIDN